ncbi:MAG: hypothetical protein ABI068_17205, partial [Ktedonobacterales bacterium]
GLDFRAPLRPGRGAAEAHDAIRQLIPTLTDDRTPAPDIEALATALRGGLLDELVPEATLDTATAHHTTRATQNGKRARVEDADQGGRGRH